MKTETISIKKITPAPFQPRTEFDREKLKELADSMDAQGLLQPIVVRPREDGYQLIAGERRFRAAQMLGWKEIRAEVSEMNDAEAEEKSAVENFQRANLTSVESEDMIWFLWEHGGPNGTAKKPDGITPRYESHGELAKALGLSRMRVSDSIRAKEARSRLGLVGVQDSNENITTHDLHDTEGIQDRSVRKSLLEAKSKEKITATSLSKYARAIKDAPKPLAEEVVKKPDVYTPQVTEAIKEIKSPERQQQIIKAVVKVSTGTGDTEKDEAARVEFVKREVEYEKIEPVLLESAAELQAKFEDLGKDYERLKKDLLSKVKTEDQKMYGRLFANVYFHFHMKCEYEDTNENFFCPACGGDRENLRWACCGTSLEDAMHLADGKYDEFITEYKKRHPMRKFGEPWEET